MKSETANNIFEAYKAFNGCVLSPSLIQKYIVPGLNLLKEQIVNESYKHQLNTMLKEMMENSKTTDTNNPEKKVIPVEKVSFIDKFKNLVTEKHN